MGFGALCDSVIEFIVLRRKLVRELMEAYKENRRKKIVREVDCVSIVIFWNFRVLIVYVLYSCCITKKLLYNIY